MGLSYSTTSKQENTLKKINDIIETDNNLMSNFNSDTLEDLTEIKEMNKSHLMVGGSDDYLHNNKQVHLSRDSEFIHEMNKVGGNKHEKYDIRNIMGRVHDKVLTAGADILQEEHINYDVSSIALPTEEPLFNEYGNNLINNTDSFVDNSEMNLNTTDTNERLEDKILNTIFNHQNGGGDDSSSSSSSSDSDSDSDLKKKKLKKNKHNSVNKDNKHNKYNKRDTKQSDTSSNKDNNYKKYEKETVSEKHDNDNDDDDDEINLDDSVEEITETSNEPESGGGLSIFPFHTSDSQSNSYQHYRMLKRAI